VPEVADIEDHEAGHVLDGELARHGRARPVEGESGAAERRCRVLGDVEEVGRAEMVVAALVTGADRRHVDGHLDA